MRVSQIPRAFPWVPGWLASSALIRGWADFGVAALPRAIVILPVSQHAFVQGATCLTALSRLENGVNRKDVASMGYAIARCVVKQLPRKTRQVILDIDAYEDPCHGQQELELFNGFYDSHCYLPLALFVTGGDGVQRILGAVLRSGKGGSAGVEASIKVAVATVRERFPKARIILRADAGFGNADVLKLCDELKISYILGLSSNSRLQTLSTKAQMRCCWLYTFGKAEWQDQGACRLFRQFQYKAGSWQHKHRVIVRVEITDGKLNPRYIVTNMYQNSPEKAYAFYCGRGDIENRIKEFKLDLFAGQEAAKGTSLANAQAGTIRLKLLKLGARVVETTRRIWLHMSSSFPHQAV